MSPSEVRDFDFASEAHTKPIYERAEPWLVMHGEYHVYPSDVIYGRHETGLPIRTESDRHVLTIPGERLYQVVPKAAGYLAVGEQMKLTLYPAHFYYSLEDNELTFAHTTLEFWIFGLSQLDEVAFGIEGQDSSDPWSVSKRYLNRPRAPLVTPDDLIRRAEALELNDQFGVDRVTVGECQALHDIVTHLDDLTDSEG